MASGRCSCPAKEQVPCQVESSLQNRSVAADRCPLNDERDAHAVGAPGLQVRVRIPGVAGPELSRHSVGEVDHRGEPGAAAILAAGEHAGDEKFFDLLVSTWKKKR